MKPKPDWDVKVHKYGTTYVTEFHVGVQGFTLARVSVDKHTNHTEARQHAIFTQIMFLKALQSLGIEKPGGVPDLRKAIKRKVAESPSKVVPPVCCHGTKGCFDVGDKHWCDVKGQRRRSPESR